jgi:hypothetical protein
MTDVAALRQVLRKKELTRVGFVRSQCNLADGITKTMQRRKEPAKTSVLRMAKLPFVVEEFKPREFLPVSNSRAKPAMLLDTTTLTFLASFPLGDGKGL